MTRYDDKQKHFYALISLVLQIGVIASAVLIVIGLVLYFSQARSGDYHQFVRPDYSFPHSFGSIKSGLHRSGGLAYITAGLLVLILTPILRVATSILLFISKKDKPMAYVTISVLIILIGSFLLGYFVK